MNKLIIDTNKLMSALITPKGRTAAKIMKIINYSLSFSLY
jgi:predicted nucleic acid-binding protein